MKKITWYAVTLLLLSFLVACGTASDNDTTGEGTPTEEEISNPDNDEEEVLEEDTIEEEAPAEEGDDPVTDETPTSSDPSETKKIEVVVEGEQEMREAQFHRSGLGYGIYILENFKLEEEEPRRDVILSEYDGEYFTRIIQEGESIDPESLKQTILDHAQGDIEEESSNQLDGAHFTLREVVEVDDEITSIYHTAKTIDGQTYSFTMFVPNREPAEGLAPSMWAMLKTFHP